MRTDAAKRTNSGTEAELILWREEMVWRGGTDAAMEMNGTTDAGHDGGNCGERVTFLCLLQSTDNGMYVLGCGGVWFFFLFSLSLFLCAANGWEAVCENWSKITEKITDVNTSWNLGRLLKIHSRVSVMAYAATKSSYAEVKWSIEDFSIFYSSFMLTCADIIWYFLCGVCGSSKFMFPGVQQSNTT